MNTLKLVISLLVCSLLANVNAEISGSGFRQEGCNGKIDIDVFVDNNGNGKEDGDDYPLEQVAISITRSSAPELGTDTLTTNSQGKLRFFNLCPDTYEVRTLSHTLPNGLVLTAAIDEEEEIDLLDPTDSSLPVNVLVEESGQQSHKKMIFGVQNLSCSLVVEASCEAVDRNVSNVPSTADYQCKKPMEELTMIWNGDDAIRVVAHYGKIDDDIIADIDHILLGSEVSIAGLTDSPNDVIWEIYAAGTDNKIGESAFHVSCSDNDMNDPLDCGKAAGDGKNNDKCSDGNGSCINDWIFEGLIDKEGEINCTEDYPTDGQQTGVASCDLMEAGEVDFQYSLVNTSSEYIVVNSVTDSQLGELPGIPANAMAPGEVLAFFYADTVEHSQIRQISVTGLANSEGEQCQNDGYVEVTVLPPPDICDGLSVNLSSMSHDKIKMEISNNGTLDVTYRSIDIIWPEENQDLKEIKAQGNKIFDEEIPWRPSLHLGEADFQDSVNLRTIEADKSEEIEIKFTEHVHNSEQIYDVTFDFGYGCELNFDNSTP